MNKILRARNNHEKEYLVSVNRPINKDFIQRMSNGVEILDTKTKNCLVKQLGQNEKSYSHKDLIVRLGECESLGYSVKSLKR